MKKGQSPTCAGCPASWQPQPSECTQCVSVNPVVAARGGGALAVVPSVKLRHPTSEQHSTECSTQYRVQYGDRGGDSGGWRALGGDGGDRGVRDQDELPPRADGRHLHPALPPAGSLPRHVSPEHSPSHHIHILQ